VTALNRYASSVLRLLRRWSWRKAAIFVASMMLFVLALELMKAGARALAPIITGFLEVDNPVNALGFGWLFAYGILSGSPVAAVALTLFDTGLLDSAGAFSMITGSRLGASLIVLIIGLIYMLRGHERTRSMITGLLSFIVTATIYLPALPIGYLMLTSGIFERLDVRASGDAFSIIDVIYGPSLDLVKAYLPRPLIFVIGLLVIIGTFNLFDKALPELKLQESAFDRVPRVLYRPSVTFLLGLAVTSVTMSVSVSLGLLVPLSARGYIRRENLIPYIMGCNVSTFVDTLIAGLLLRNVHAAGIVLAEMISILIISLVVLVFFFRSYERAILKAATWLEAGTTRLAVFFATIFVIPIILLLIR
jgi:Na+/phosphate symporter